MHWSSIIFWIGAALVAVILAIARRRRLLPMLNRACAGRDWRQTFPDAPKDEIRAFLQLFVDGFALRQKHYLAFRPTDRIMDIYRAINPRWVGVDSLKLEIF